MIVPMDSDVSCCRSHHLFCRAERHQLGVRNLWELNLGTCRGVPQKTLDLTWRRALATNVNDWSSLGSFG